MCLDSVFAALKDVKGEVIVVDNNSTEKCTKLIRKNFPEVKLIENQENKGFSKAVNQGARKAVGEYLLILNPDVILPENSLKFVLKFVEDQKVKGALGCRFIDGSGNVLPECKRNFPGMSAAMAKLFGMNAGYYADHLNDKENGEVEVLTGAFMFLKKDLFDQMKGFDEDFFMYGEDIDLSYRIFSSGHKNWYLGDLTVIHFKGESSIKNLTYLKHFYGALEIFFVKHFRHNAVSRGLLRTLVQSAVWFRTRSARETEATQTRSESFKYRGTREGVYAALKHKFGENLEWVASGKELKGLNPGASVFFDTFDMSFEKIIEAIETLHDGVSRRIISKQGDFYVGSDNAKDRGKSERLRP